MATGGIEEDEQQQIYVQQTVQLLNISLTAPQQQAVTQHFRQLVAIAAEVMAAPIPATLESLTHFEP